MTYSTCSISVLENEGIVRWVIDNFPFMKLIPIDIQIGQPGLDNAGLSPSERMMVRRFDPNTVIDTMGFFVAKFQKTK